MPVDTDGLTPRARALAAAIRSIREESETSGRVLSKRLGLSHGTLSHWETGRRIPTAEDVASLLTALDVTGEKKERLVELARHAREPNWLTVGMPGIPDQLAGAVEHERAASSITEWAPLGLPGLLQTTDYARSISTESGLSLQEVESRVMLRIARREVIRQEEPVRLLALIGEAALRDRIGTHDVMVKQLQYLKEVSTWKNVTVLIVPSRAGWHPGLSGPFVLYEFLDAPPVVHFEHYSSGAFVPDAADVWEYQKAVGVIREKALSTVASTRLIATIADETEKVT